MARRSSKKRRGTNYIQGLVTYPADILRQVAEPVDFADEAANKQLANRLRMAMHNMEHAYGVAAPQIGVSKRMFCWRDGRKLKVIVNPEIIEYSPEKSTNIEGCLSLPGLFWPVERSLTLHIKGYTLRGEETDREIPDELTARIFQHEIDHFDGKLILDLLSDEERAELRFES